MKTNKQHNTQWSDDDFMKSLPEIELSFSKSKEDVWSELSALIDEKETTETVQPKKQGQLKQLNIVYAAAAVIVLLLSTTAFLRLYTKTIAAGAGQHLTALLPDGSSIELNASSTIQYHPYWWRFNREVKFEGEGFFKVQKGQSFEVVSTKGRTIVLGTSFNIYARKNDYKVTCYTGKVRVVSVVSGESTDITPNQQAIIKTDGKVISHTEINTDETISWINDQFIFTGTPLYIVFEEIERQYGISIQTKEKLSYNYSGNFTRKQSADEVMHKVCLGLGLKYQKVDGGYLVSK